MSLSGWRYRFVMLLATAGSLGLGSVYAEGASGDVAAEHDLVERARKIHRSVLTLDTHVDIPGGQYATEKLDPGIDHPMLKCDLVKMVEGDVDGVFLVVYVGQGRRDAEGYAQAHSAAMAKFDAIRRLTDTMYPDRCALAATPDDVERIARTGKRVVMIGVENGYTIGTDLSNLKRFYDLGARYVTLSHNGHNQICDSCNPSEKLGDAEAEHGGLSEFGRKVVAEMNRLGMMIDVSHIAVQSFWDLVDASEAPLIASHSGCRALNDNPRNLHDDQLQALAAGGGVVQLVALGSFLKATTPGRRRAINDLAARLGIPMEEGHPELKEATEEQRDRFRAGMKRVGAAHPPASLEDYVDHVDHAVRVAGIDHVGIGTDFDGGGGISGFDDHSEALNLTVELIRRGYSKQDVAKIWGGNILRVWREVEGVAAESR